MPVWRPREGKRGSVLEVCGTTLNLTIAEHTHAFLLHTAERLWSQYRRELRRRQPRSPHLSGGRHDRLPREARRPAQAGTPRPVWSGSATATSPSIGGAVIRTSASPATPAPSATRPTRTDAPLGAASSCSAPCTSASRVGVCCPAAESTRPILEQPGPRSALIPSRRDAPPQCGHRDAPRFGDASSG